MQHPCLQKTEQEKRSGDFLHAGTPERWDARTLVGGVTTRPGHQRTAHILQKAVVLAVPCLFEGDETDGERRIQVTRASLFTSALSFALVPGSWLLLFLSSCSPVDWLSY
jgi:hypothetical protein